MFTRQADLRTRLKAIQDACAEEETERQALEEKLQQTATDLEQKVAEVPTPPEPGTAWGISWGVHSRGNYQARKLFLQQGRVR